MQKTSLLHAIFCDKTDSADNLNEYRTLYLDKRVRKIAHDSNNSQLIAKLSEEDMVATEANTITLVSLTFVSLTFTTNTDQSIEIDQKK